MTSVGASHPLSASHFLTRGEGRGGATHHSCYIFGEPASAKWPPALTFLYEWQKRSNTYAIFLAAQGEQGGYGRRRWYLAGAGDRW